MNTYRCLPFLTCKSTVGVLVLAGLASPLARGATLWTGPNINYTKSAQSTSDVIIAGKVVLTRGSSEVLYNIAAGETFATVSSPADTAWAFGQLTNFASLTYQSMGSLRSSAGGNLSAFILNKPMVVHLLNEDIYFSIKFTTWGQFGAGTVAYTRSTAAAVVTPAVNITSPANGQVFTAPANVSITAKATASNGGTVTNVSFFNGTTLLGSVESAPFSLVASNLEAGAYSLTAVAMAAGRSATSAVVNITVNVSSPVAVTASPPVATNGLVSFTYNVDPGLSYIIQASSDLSGWVPIATNVAGSGPATFSEPIGSTSSRFYRVARQPSP